MDTQEKFTAALRERAHQRGLELVVERTYADSGFYSLQPPGSFCPVLRLPFAFRTGYSSFDGGVGEPGPLGLRADGTPWSGVRGGEHDEVLARVTEILDAGEAAPLRGCVGRRSRAGAPCPRPVRLSRVGASDARIS